MDNYEWDPAKAESNLKKHGVDFADAALSLEDENALVEPDPTPTTRSVILFSC